MAGNTAVDPNMYGGVKDAAAFSLSSNSKVVWSVVGGAVAP
jgi:hypothetical protein